MPATMMHLLAGYELSPEGSDSFFLGCVLPDCLDYDRVQKDHLHLRDIPKEERLTRLVQMGTELDLNRDFDFGVLHHLYLDYLWDNGPQLVHKKNYQGDEWFRDYRKELRAAGNRVAQRMPWSEPVLKRLLTAEKSAYENTLSLEEDAIRAFLDFNYNWHTTVALPESRVFTDELVDAFVRRANRAFRVFLNDFFPKVAQNRHLV